MIGYSAANVFTPAELELHRQATAFVADIPEDLRIKIRCHELVRAAQIFLERCIPRLRTVDGLFGIVEHSWLEVMTQPNRHRHVILDVYAVGSVPMVQLIDAGTLGIREARQYHGGVERTDIDASLITSILVAHAQRSSSLNLQKPVNFRDNRYRGK